MTASPTPPDFFAENANKSATAGPPSEEEIADEIQRYIPTFHGAREAARAILDLIRPAFEAKEREIERWQQHSSETEAELQAAEAKLAQAVEAHEVVRRIADVAASVGRQAGVGASETAGLIVSVLAANPEQTPRFMAEGSELFIDGTMRTENGCLSHLAMNGEIVSPTKVREMKGQSQ